MDWGTALGGMDDELKNILVRNKMMQDNQLTPLRALADVQNSQADNARADVAAEDLAKYHQNEIDVRNRGVARQEAADDAKQKEKDELNTLSAAWAQMPEGPEKQQAGALLSARIRGFKNGGSVLSVVTNPDGTQKLVNLGAKAAGDQVITPKGANAGPQMDISDDMAQLLADAVRGGDRHAMDVLGRAGTYNSMARQKVLDRVTGTPLPKDYSFAEAMAANKADSAVLGKITNSIAQQEVLRNATQQNFDVMMKTMDKIPDWGSPMMNVAPRYIAANIISPAEMKAFQTARMSALREYVRLIGSNIDAKGQIHQSTQDAYEQLLNDDTPMASMVEAMKVMNQDMNNLKTSLETEKENVKKELTNRGKTPVEVPAGHTGATATVTMGENGAPEAAAPPKQIVVPKALVLARMKRTGEDEATATKYYTGKPRESDGAIYVIGQ